MNNRNLKIFFLKILGPIILLAAAGCHTVEGAAKDVEQGADAVGDAAHDASH